MIRVRRKDGSVLEADDGFVEVCDQEGNIGLVFFQPGASSFVHQIEPDTTDARRYRKLFPQVKFCKTVTIKD